jgi:hypothetical protein
MSKTKASSVKRAKPLVRKPKSDVAAVTMTRSKTTAMKGSSLWAQSPDLQAANTAWNKAADAMEKNAKDILDLRTQLSVLETAQVGLRHEWDAATEHMTGVVSVASQGDPALVLELGYDVRTRTLAGSIAAPEGLQAALGKAVGEARFTWIRGDARHGFIVQHASDVANQATYSVPAVTTRVKYTLKGATAPVYFRVAAIDPSSPTGQSPWSAWVAGTVR